MYYINISDTWCMYVMSLKLASGRFFVHFKVFEQYIDIHFREILINFLEKVVYVRQILDLHLPVTAHFLESP